MVNKPITLGYKSFQIQLQELTWDNYVTVSKADAERLGLS